MKQRITGTMFYYFFVCKRKLWYHTQDIQLENDHESVVLGKLLDENSYSRDSRNMNINNTISIDFLRDRNIIHEVKKSKSIEDASIWQVKYYLYYLKERGANVNHGKLDYPLLRESMDIELSEKDINKIREIEREIVEIINTNSVPEKLNNKICKKCAFYEFCFI